MLYMGMDQTSASYDGTYMARQLSYEPPAPAKQKNSPKKSKHYLCVVIVRWLSDAIVRVFLGEVGS